jgi:hypothetical protein
VRRCELTKIRRGLQELRREREAHGGKIRHADKPAATSQRCPFQAWPRGTRPTVNGVPYLLRTPRNVFSLLPSSGAFSTGAFAGADALEDSFAVAAEVGARVFADGSAMVLGAVRLSVWRGSVCARDSSAERRESAGTQVC